MAPWDELNYFDLPLVTNYALTAGAKATQILEPNPMRVAFLIGMSLVSSGTFVAIGPNTFPLTTAGFLIGNSQQPLTITQAQHGSLCACAWYAQALPGNTDVIVAEVTMSKWPHSEDTSIAKILAALKALLPAKG
jgi:hypothetical protein